jgi:MoxR-like ATPase
MSTGVSGSDGQWLAERFRALSDAVAGIVIGQDEAIRFSFITVLCGGHSLYEGAPGLAKTLLVRCLAAALGIRFGRIQFTPDLMPSDVIGSPVFNAGTGEFRFRPGPLFTDTLLADEINRAPAKTQAALLEAMQEQAATVDGTRHELGDLFSVFATQNPIDQEGTYPLPEAELDRFLFKILIDYPSPEAELAILEAHHRREPRLDLLPVVLQADDLRRARLIASELLVQGEVLRYAVDLIGATRQDPSIAVGGSPRAGLWLVRAAKAVAALEGRDYVLPEDVQHVWLPVLRHRVILEPSAEVEGISSDEALRGVLRAVPTPQ